MDVGLRILPLDDGVCEQGDRLRRTGHRADIVHAHDIPVLAAKVHLPAGEGHGYLRSPHRLGFHIQGGADGVGVGNKWMLRCIRSSTWLAYSCSRSVNSINIIKKCIVPVKTTGYSAIPRTKPIIGRKSSQGFINTIHFRYTDGPQKLVIHRITRNIVQRVTGNDVILVR